LHNVRSDDDIWQTDGDWRELGLLSINTSNIQIRRSYDPYNKLALSRETYRLLVDDDYNWSPIKMRCPS
jgi:hypothetical protein